MNEQKSPPVIIESSGQIRLSGEWTTSYLKQLQKISKDKKKLSVQQIYISRLDTNGARVLLEIIGDRSENWPEGLSKEQLGLLSLVKSKIGPIPNEQADDNLLSTLGRQVFRIFRHGRELLDFAGQLTALIVSLLRHPRQLKVKMLLDVLQRDGLNAVPIIALLAFLLGAVIAFQGGLQLATYGANIFVVELISLIMLRELAPLICAIIVAGRSGSAFAAQLATMQMNQEVLALKSLGQDPFAWLVLPKLLGLMLVMPLLTVLSMVTGIGGGMVVAMIQLDLSPVEFIQRFGSVVDPIHFWVGLIKAPVFALLIVNVGCMQGMLAKGGAEAVGHRTTRSVVQSIFLVIIVDALFSILFAQLGW